MKKLWSLLLCVIILAGCGRGNNELEPAMQLRTKILQAETCTFTAKITADYGDMVYTFTLQCKADRDGNVTFTVSSPETIEGITGRITADGGAITFDDTVLCIPLLTDDQLTPVSSPWILMRALRTGYIRSCGENRVVIDDSYASDALTLDFKLSGEGLPELAEIYWKNRRILTVQVVSFSLS